jgi:3-hydroxymyristoyl/3-hydroxydecanoyl-(acyl carrier protein) dehydratase
MMRYRFIDKVVSLALDGHPRIEVEKTFHGDDDAFTGPSGPARVPDSLLLELMAMTGGHLVFHHLGGSRLPLLLKVPECRFESPAGPGVALRAVADLTGVSPIGDDASVAEASTAVYTGGECLAAGTLLYLCVSVPGVDLATYEAKL